jgi:peptidyl-prolyl cis-trans isomerase D
MTLDSIRRGVSRFLIFLLFGVLILSFALWGIPNFTRDLTQANVARVGSIDVGAQEMQRIVEQQRLLLSQEMGQNLTRENARLVYKLRQRNMAADLERDVLLALVDRAAMDQHARNLGLSLSEPAIVEIVRNDPMYQGADKQFSRTLFDEHVRQLGYTHPRYFAERRADAIRQMLGDSLNVGAQAPMSLVDILHKYREEKRTITYATLDPAKLPPLPEPDEAALKAHYELIKRQFSEPERRPVTAMLLTRDRLQKLAAIDDAEVKAHWEANRTTYDLPERRRWQQIVYATRAEAETAAKDITAGKSFLVAALEVMGVQGRPDQGLIARSDVPDARLATAAFQLSVGQLSQPIETRGGWVLAKLMEIQPARTRGFDEVAPDIRSELQQNRQGEVLRKINTQIEELRGERRKLPEIAKELALEVFDTPAVDRAGNGADGKPAIAHADSERIVAAAFDIERAGGERDDVELSESGRAWLEVGAIQPAKQKPYEDVGAQVKTAWQEAERRKALSAAADTFVQRLTKGEKLEDIAAKEKWPLQPTDPFKRSDLVPGLSPTALRQAFALPINGAGSAETNDGKARTIFVVRTVTPAPAATAEQTEALRRELRTQYQNDALAIYVQAVRDRIGYTVNEAVYKRVVGGEQTP